MQLDAYIIMRNEKYWLPMSLASIYDLCDRIFVVDNGSTDGSAKIAEDFGDKVQVIYAPGDGFADPDMGEVDLRNIGIDACLRDNADLILRWDCDEVLYEGQEKKIRALWNDRGYGAWKFQCHRFVSDFSWVQDLRDGESGHAADGSYDLVGYGNQSGQGKIVLFRANPDMEYTVNPHYVGLHSSEFDSVMPRLYRTVGIWYIHGEWCRSNKRLYNKALLYYSLVRDENDWCRTQEFRDMIDPENVFYPKGPIHEYQRIRPFGLRKEERSLPKAMEGFELPVKTIVGEDKDGRYFVKKRIWEGSDEI